MKIDVNQITDVQVTSTAEKSYDMKMDAKRLPLFFKMLVENMYQNRLGSMIREVASNAIDSHTEAGVKDPIIISYTKEGDNEFISFIDKGVGMSPDRVEKVYCQLGESTKRDSNDQIGGFGIGGKTPFAYAESKSFFIITRYDGIEYFYNARMDTYLPKVDLVYEKETKDHNGTEVKVPLSVYDKSKAEREIKRQLFYFDNVYFKGWEDDTLNDYNIYEGENFRFRSSDVYSKLHVSLGNVAYPINWENMEIEEVDIPIALKFNTGELTVTPSREGLEYTKKAQKLIEDKIELAKAEIRDMLIEKYKNVQTLSDYFTVTDDFGELTLPNTDKTINVRNLIKKSEVDFTKFKYNELVADGAMIGRDAMLETFFEGKRYGHKEKTRGWDSAKQYDNRFSEIKSETSNVYGSKETVFTRNNDTTAYLKDKHDGRFYVLRKKYVDDYALTKFAKRLGLINYGDDFNILTPNQQKLVKDMIEDFIGYVFDNVPMYEDINVPQSFIDDRKAARRKAREANVFEGTIKVKGAWSGRRASNLELKNLKKFRGTIIYGFRDDQYTLQNAYSLSEELFGDKHTHNGVGYYGNIENGMVFIQIAQNNLKKLQGTGVRMYHCDNFYKLYVVRKLDAILAHKYAEKVQSTFNNVNSFFTMSGFDNVHPVIAEKVSTIQKWINENRKNKYNLYRLDNYKFMLATGVDLRGDDEDKALSIENFKHYDLLQDLIKLSKKYQSKLRWIECRSYTDLNEADNRELVELLKLVVK